ncbi:HEAT repeat domain-containing protein [Kitasatospora sp. NA04385]|uniref:HEAT repeat domain-containing protein n=1 Tax=Kitasatospora sp. NA04385 TaxID=2742135 RepID=UPI00159117CF|nr:HEAT repeat domain-containing protein [Kitasatospora sp. NA04385]QKW21640.1 HEAT repeat domain-containing protein [Kitasatospora sp. NA04385]
MTTVDEAWRQLTVRAREPVLEQLRRAARGEPVVPALYRWDKGMDPAAPAALPFLIALVREPDRPNREELLSALARLVGVGRQEAAERHAHGWAAAWREHRTAVEPLLDDPEPEVRRTALYLTERAAPLLARIPEESEPWFRAKQLIRLGEVADPADDAARALLTDTLHGADGPDAAAHRLAALWGLAALDAAEPERWADQWVAAVLDPAAPAVVERLWTEPDDDHPATLGREIIWTGRSLPLRLAAHLTVRLARAAAEAGRHELCEVALDAGWRPLLALPSVGPLWPATAGALLSSPAPEVRHRAAAALAVLGRAAVPYADALHALLDDTDSDECLDGSTADQARWALARIGDPRVLPDLVRRLTAVERENGRGFVRGDPRRPEPYDALLPLHEHAAVLRPQVARWAREGESHAWPDHHPGVRLLAAWDAPADDAKPPPPPDPEAAARGLLRIPPVRRSHEDPAPYLLGTRAVAALSWRGPLSAGARAAVEHALSLDRRLSWLSDYRAVLDDERLREVLRRALRGEAVTVPPLSHLEEVDFEVGH